MVNGHDSQNTRVICLGGTAVDGNRGGIIGGMAGHYLGAEAGDLANDAIVEPINEGQSYERKS